jgi:hypothetical protein
MSVLLVETLQDELVQDIDFTETQRVEIAAFIPYIYFHNVTGAVFTFEIEKNSEIVFSQDFSSEDIRNSVNASYAHVFYPIIPVNPVQLDEASYKFRIKRKSGYLAGSEFIGWVKQYVDVQNIMSYTPTDDSENTFAIRFKRLREGITV